MKRVGFEMKIKTKNIKEYKEWHDKVWPEMLEALRRNGWKNYSIFLRKDGTLFGYFEVEDSFENALKRMSKEKVNTDWQNLMSPFFELPEGAHPDKNMIEWEEVFHLD
ncbi:MAG: L-rhamnose mutarotase [Dehalococcoidia bacterium]